MISLLLSLKDSNKSLHYICYSQGDRNRIRKQRELKDLLQTDIAAKLKLTPGAYAKIERGETDPSITRLYEIATILKVDILVLLEDTPRQKESPVTRAEFNNLHSQLDALRKQVKELNSISSTAKKDLKK